MKSPRAFTLIELLVVIAIIALVMGILLPSLGRTREQARQRLCASRERQQLMAMILYAQDNDSKLPAPAPGERGLWELDSRTVDFLVRYGLHKKIFYCPSNRTQQQYMDLYWQVRDTLPLQLTKASSFRRGVQPAIGPAPTPPPDPRPQPQSPGSVASGYCYILETPQSPRPEILNELNKTGAKAWARTTVEKQGGRQELVVDVTLSRTDSLADQGTRFASIQGGTLWESHQVADQSSHLKTEQQPLGANIGFLDGHVAWRHFKEMEPRYTVTSGLTFWW